MTKEDSAFTACAVLTRLGMIEGVGAIAAVLQNLPLGAVVAEAPSGRLLLANDRVSRVLRRPFVPSQGIEAYGEWQGRHADGRPYANDEWPLARSIRDGEVIKDEKIRMLRGDGTTAVVSVSSFPLRDNTGTVTAAIAVFDDVTESEESREALQESEERFRAFMNNTATIAWMKDAEGRHVYISESGLRRFSIAKDWLGKTDFEIWPRDIAEAFRRNDLQVLQSGEPTEVVEENRAPDGGQSYWLNFKFPFRDSSGRQYIGGIGVDITERRRTEQALEAREREYRTLAENAPEVIARIDRQLRHTYVNEYGARVYGVPRDEIIGKTNAELGMPADKVAFWEEHFEAVFASGKQRTVEFEFDSPNLGHQHFSSLFVPELDEGGEVSSILAITRDVTEQKKAESALRESEERLRALIETSFEGIVTTEHGRIRDCSEQFARMLGYTCAELKGKSAREVVPPEYSERVLRYILEERALPYETEMLRKDGSRIWVEFRGRTVRREGHAVRQAVARDITERKRAEETLRESEERYRALMTASSEVLYRMSPDWSEMRQLHSRGFLTETTEPSRGWMQEYIYPDDMPRVTAAISEAIRTKSTFELEHRVRRADGGMGWTFSRAIPMLDAGGEIVEWFGAASDITKRKEAEAALKRAHDELEERVRERTAELEFRMRQLRALALELTRAEERERKRLAAVLHDHLQQLLVGTKFAVLSMDAEAERGKLCEAISNVVELLDESIRESKSLSVELSPPILHEDGLAAAVRWLARWMEEKHGLTVRVDARDEIEPDAEGVGVLLFQSVRELLLNVVKHARVREAAVSIARAEGSVEVAVSDRGAGFDTSQATSTGTAGGFGLYSIRERLDLLGGKVRIESEPGTGTRVVLTAPLPTVGKQAAADLRAAAATTERIAAVAAASRHIRVLIADDHKILREGLARLLHGEPDMKVVGEASDGQAAVEMARELKPDVVVMDIGMPVMNGIEATRTITLEMPHVRVIGLSMYEEADRARAMIEAGAVAYVHKAGASERLVEEIRAAGARGVDDRGDGG